MSDIANGEARRKGHARGLEDALGGRDSRTLGSSKLAPSDAITGAACFWYYDGYWSAFNVVRGILDHLAKPLPPAPPTSAPPVLPPSRLRPDATPAETRDLLEDVLAADPASGPTAAEMRALYLIVEAMDSWNHKTFSGNGEPRAVHDALRGMADHEVQSYCNYVEGRVTLYYRGKAGWLVAIRERFLPEVKP